MKQVLQNFRSGALKVDEAPEPCVARNGVLVRNQASLISAGTEKMTIELAQKSLLGKAQERPDLVRQVFNKLRKDGLANTFNTVKARLAAPLALGYSCAGVVLEVGSGAEEFQVGERVACAGMNYASHAEVVFVPKNLAVKIPAEVSFAEAAFVTLGAIALHGLRTAEAKLGETVAVIGLGLLGQLTVQLLKAAGCRVIGIDLDAGKLELARQLGADACLLRSKQVEELVAQLTGAAGVDAVVITAASETNDPLELAGAIARDRATVAVVGAVKLEVPRKLYYEKELQLRLSRSYGPGRYDAQYEEQGIDYPIGYVRWTERRNMQEFLRLVATKAVQLAPLVTHRFPIERAEQAYDVITGKTREAYLGVLLTYANERPPGGAVVTLRPLPKNATAQTAGFVSLGVIGAGNFARSVLLPRLAANAQVILHGIATATGRNAKAVGEQYGFGFCTTDYRELLKRAEINAVLIATRHNLHAQLTAEAVRAGKTVYVEKPLALTATELAEVRAAVANHAGRVMVGFNRRFSPLSLKLKQAFSHGAPLAISYRVNAGAVPPESWIQSEEGGGRIVGEVCHFVDYLQFLTDAEPVEVFAYANAAGADTLSIVVKLSDGSVGNINYFATGDRGLAKERVEVYGGGCAGVLDDFRALECWREGRKRATRRFRQEKGFAEGLAAFVEAARTDAAMPIAWRSLVLTTLATLRIEGALRSGRPAPVELFDEL